MKALTRFSSVETSDVRPQWLLVAAALLVVVTAFCVVAAVLIVSFDRPPAAELAASALRRGIRLETDPRADGDRLQQAAKTRLETYGWSDQRRGLAHVPIARAMDLLAAHGWPDEEER